MPLIGDLPSNPYRTWFWVPPWKAEDTFYSNVRLIPTSGLLVWTRKKHFSTETYLRLQTLQIIPIKQWPQCSISSSCRSNTFHGSVKHSLHSSEIKELLTGFHLVSIPEFKFEQLHFVDLNIFLKNSKQQFFSWPSKQIQRKQEWEAIVKISVLKKLCHLYTICNNNKKISAWTLKVPTNYFLKLHWYLA